MVRINPLTDIHDVSIENDILKLIGETPLDLHIDYFQRTDDICISINNGRPQSNQALNWQIDYIRKDDGSIFVETNSWSGLDVTTIDKISDLKESVRVIEKLSKINWVVIFNRIMKLCNMRKESTDYEENNA